MQTTIQKLKEKIKLFQKNLADYKNKNYDEYNTRADFIDFVFSAFGWDMYNEQGVIEQFREVIREDKIEIEGRKKAPDYSFRIGQQIIFYVEAKRPSVDIKNDPEPAYQLRRYAYTQGLKLSILTDFEEIAVYDTRVKPEPKDKAGIARIFYCTFNELFENTKLEGFETNFDFLFKTFSKQAILTGSFNQYAEKNKNKKGTETVDKQFLNLLDTWRKNLAIRIALKNENLDEYHLNIAVQKIIDRLIFLRIAEDRLIEKANLLREIANESNIFGQLLNIFKKADKKYNSGLFISEEWLKNLSIEDNALKSIIEEMYYPKCPYEFSVLPLEILGQAYEQFLGKTIKYIRKTKYGHKVKIEEKPEVRKAGGVYYTPQYIVNYIVKNTVGEKLKKKNPDEIAKLKILDPACGSGSFLIGAYDHILRYYLKFYLKNETRKKKALKDGVIYQMGKEKYKLSTGKKSEILVNNIYGVDIDNQAVEVTKLSLLLKVLEDENLEYREQLFKAEHHHLLPDLSNNIKCGNSLIGSDFYEDKNLSLFDNNKMRKINTFDWDREFADIFKSGGFDCVIGNPPYVFTRGKGFTEYEKNYFYSHYKLSQYQINTFILLSEKAFNFLIDNGCFGFIVPNNWLTIDSNSDLREFLLKNTANLQIINFNDKAFRDANVDTCLLLFKKDKDNKFEFGEWNIKKSITLDTLKIFPKIEKKNIKAPNFYLPISKLKNAHLFPLLDKIEKNCQKLEDCAHVSTGIKSYQVGKGKPIQTAEIKDNRIYHSFQKEDNNYWKYLEGRDVNRYNLCWNKKEYIKYGKNLAEPRFSVDFSNPRILVRQIPNHPPYCFHATYTEKKRINDINSMVILNSSVDCDLKFILGVVNSRVLSFWFYYTFDKFSRKIFPQFKVKELKIFPLPQKTKEQHDRLVSLVDQMLETQKKLHSAQTDSDKKFYKQKSNILDKQIDKLVYGLYELNDEEIKIITN